MKQLSNIYLFIGGIISYFISIVHLIAILIGPQAYDFLDAPELANLHLDGSMFPTILTSILTITFFIFGCYGLSGAGIIKKLPAQSIILKIIATLYTLRGCFTFVFLTLYISHSPLAKLREIYFSLFALCTGIIYFIGIYQANDKK